MIELSITKLGTKKWWNGYNSHNRYSPAQEWIDGEYRWLYYKQIHRLDGPASCINGNIKWYRYNKLHRLDGPAVKRDNDGGEEWWINGVFYNSYLEYLVAVEEYKLGNMHT